jgi:hypothetical protein
VARKGVRLLAGKAGRGETPRAKLACNEYLRMGPKRSLVVLWRQYVEGATERGEAVPTLSRETIENWSRKWSWRDRAEEYDSWQDERRTVEKERVLNEGLARVDERLRSLIEKAQLLSAELDDEDKRWLEKGETIGYGDNAEGKWVREFNAPLMKEWRETLNDIAKEVGARRPASVEIESVNVLVKGYAAVDSAGNVFQGPDAWPEIAAAAAGSSEVAEREAKE